MRLVATDLDGTLLRPDGTLSPSTIGVLESLRAVDIPVVVLTSRPFWLLADVPCLLDGIDYAVCDNGASVRDLRRSRVVRETTWPGPGLLTVIDNLRSLLPAAAFAVESPHGTIAEVEFIALAGGCLDARRVRRVEQLDPVIPVLKLMVICARHTPERLVDLAAPGLDADTHATHSGSPYIELGPPGSSKATALAGLCESLGVAPAEVIAFGDMPNDLELLRWAGTGVAMGNAHPAVIAAADQFAPANHADGFAHHLKSLLYTGDPRG
jgi:Cof subfamily protein (haloacid dehalogenase superfamily)